VSDRNARFVSLYTAAASLADIVCAPLLAVAYFATKDGASELQAGSVSAWARPARDLFGGLETFASTQTVYDTYGRVYTLLMPALLLGALAAHTLRPSRVSRPERWGWRLALTGYGLTAIGVAGAFWTPFRDPFFLIVMVPGILVSLLGSTTLGISLLRAGFRPRASAWLLALSLPLMVVGSVVLGHNSLGMVPLFVAWALACRRPAADTVTHAAGVTA
jgi:hypothetical protein